MTRSRLTAAALLVATLALWADLIRPGSLLPVRPSGPAVGQLLPD